MKKVKTHKINMLKKIFSHYWMCEACAKEMGGVFPQGRVCTICKGECKYCGESGVLIPHVDFKWPDGVTAKKSKD